MPWQYSDEYYTEYTRTTWNESAPACIDLMGRLEPFRVAALPRLDPRPGQVILDLGTGPGEPALTIAAAVGSQGRVAGIDLSERMVEIARQAAASRRISNVDFRVMDGAKLDFAGSSFDAAISCFGFRIFTHPERAAAEAFRVLKPGGRLLATVWSTAEKTPFLDVLIAPMLEHAEPDENGYLPTPYETGGPGEMVAFLTSAGFVDAQEQRITHTMHYANPATYLDSVLKATPIGHSLSEETPEVQREVLQKTRVNLERWVGPQGLELPAECVIASGTKP